MAKRRALVYPRMGSKGEPIAPLETAFYFVNIDQETLIPDDKDVYICHAFLNTANLKAEIKSTAMGFSYAACSIVLPAGSFEDLDDLIVAQIGEANAFFHIGAQIKANRVVDGSGNWPAKPSAALGAVIAGYWVDNVQPYFKGIYVDECQEVIPNSYWTAYKTDTNLNLTDAQRGHWDSLWKANISAMHHGLKGIFQDEMAVIANTAGATYPRIDGITIEESHINTMGQVEARRRFMAQEAHWRASPWKYRRATGPLNIAWDYPMQESGLVLGGQITIFV